MSTGKKVLRPEDIRNYKGHENITDEQAERLHTDLTQFAAILLRVYPLEKIMKEVNEASSKSLGNGH